MQAQLCIHSKDAEISQITINKPIIQHRFILHQNFVVQRTKPESQIWDDSHNNPFFPADSVLPLDPQHCVLPAHHDIRPPEYNLRFIRSNLRNQGYFFYSYVTKQTFCKPIGLFHILIHNTCNFTRIQHNISKNKQKEQKSCR